jgi:HSP20 family protein
MLAQRLNPTFPFGDLRREIDRLFDDFGFPFSSGSVRTEAFPAVNVWETPEAVFVEAEVPGLQMNDIELTVVGNELSIHGERKAVADEKATFHRRERGFGEFSRFVALPVPAETSRIEAVLRDGVLTVTLPKAPEARPRRIEVKGS